MNIIQKAYRFVFGQKKIEERSMYLSDPGVLKLFNVSDSGVNVTTNTIESITHLFRGLTIRANMMATMPRCVCRRKGRSSEIVDGHPVHTLLNGIVSDEYSVFDFVWMLEYTSLLFGGGGAEIIRDEVTGRPVRLRIFRTGCTPYKPSQKDSIRFYENETMRLFYPDEILYIPGLVVTNGTRHMSLAQMFRETFGEALATQAMVTNFMKNAPHLAAVYTYTGPRRDAQNAYSQGISDYFSGLQKAGGVLPIANGENFTQLKPVNVVEAGVVDLKRLSVEDSSRITGVPVSLLMDIKNSSYNSYAELFRQFKILTLDPRATQWDYEFTRKLLREDEVKRQFFVETMIDELMWSDPRDRTEYWTALFKMGALLPNEIRAYLNLPPVEGGDVAYIEGNNFTPLSQMSTGENVKKNGERAKYNSSIV